MLIYEYVMGNSMSPFGGFFSFHWTCPLHLLFFERASWARARAIRYVAGASRGGTSLHNALRGRLRKASPNQIRSMRLKAAGKWLLRGGDESAPATSTSYNYNYNYKSSSPHRSSTFPVTVTLSSSCSCSRSRSSFADYKENSGPRESSRSINLKRGLFGSFWKAKFHWIQQNGPAPLE